MDIQTMLNNAVTSARKESLAKSPQLTLGELILKLDAVSDKSKEVSFAFEYARPTEFDSWRGSYCELAIGFDFESKNPTTEEFLSKCREAVGKTYQGYKGGDFTMSRQTPVWVANYGNSGSTGVIDVLETDYSVILVTGYCEY